MKIKTIAVIGLGLIGGSLLKALKDKGYKLIGISRRQSTVDKALKDRIVRYASIDINLVKEADLVFICTPINKTIDTIELIKDKVKPTCIITDAASLKGFVLEHVNNSATKIRFVGGHPMAGTENRGIEAAVDGLFNKAKWVLTPSKWSNDSDILDLQKVLISIGARPILAKAEAHDKAVALISHMPMLISQALFKSVSENQEVGDLAFKLAASGFRDMTRLSMSNVEMASDMINLNRDNIMSALVDVIRCANDLNENFNTENSDFIHKYGKLIKLRKEMYNSDGNNIT